MRKNNLFVFVCFVFILAFLTISCDMGTIDYPTQKPEAVYGMKAVMTDDAKALLLTWNPSAENEASGYELYCWSDSAVGNPDTIIVRDTQYVDTQIIAGSKYFYSVRAFNGVGLSQASDAVYMVAVLIPPMQVLDLKARDVNSYSIRLDWEASNGATEYIIYRSDLLNGKYDSISVVSAPRTDFLDDDNGAGLQPKKWYYYKVQASNVSQKGGNSPMSNVDSAQTKLAPPIWLKVEILHDNVTDSAAGIGQDTVRIRWTKVKGAIGYQLYFESGLTNASFEYLKAKDTAGQQKSPFKVLPAVAPDTLDTLEYIDTDFVLHGLVKNTRLFYKVCAIDSFDTSGNYKNDAVGDKSAIDFTKGFGFATKITGRDK